MAGLEQLIWCLNGDTYHNIPDGFHGNFEGKETHACWDRFRFEDYGYNVKLNDDVYFTVTYDGDKNEESVFVNGTKVARGVFDDDELWDNTKNVLLPNCDEWLIGICGNKNLKGCLKGKVYCFRIYGRALSESEVSENYEKAKFYHENLNNEK